MGPLSRRHQLEDFQAMTTLSGNLSFGTRDGRHDELLLSSAIAAFGVATWPQRHPRAVSEPLRPFSRENRLYGLLIEAWEDEFPILISNLDEESMRFKVHGFGTSEFQRFGGHVHCAPAFCTEKGCY
jgi:hypothetical protein